MTKNETAATGTTGNPPQPGPAPAPRRPAAATETRVPTARVVMTELDALNPV